MMIPRLEEKIERLVELILTEYDSNSDYAIGLTKRELFASMAMQGMLGNIKEWGLGNISKMAVFHADALIEELNK